MKQCSKCKNFKPISSFHIRKERNNSLQSHCKDCKNQSDREKYRFKKYGMSFADYQSLLEKNGHRCSICLTHESETYKGLHIDHCHKTGKIRGLLCSQCNLAIGHLKDDVLLAERVIKYLLKV